MVLKKRTQNPPVYREYRSYKECLRLEFEYRCAYCHIHEAEDGGSKKFHIDHYLPKSKFPEKRCNYSNLFYLCADCNRLKGNYWANWIQKILHEYILNPCDHDCDIHFDRSKSAWTPKTSVAKWNIGKLRLNSEKQIIVRDARTLFLKTIEETAKHSLKSLGKTVLAVLFVIACAGLGAFLFAASAGAAAPIVALVILSLAGALTGAAGGGGLLLALT